MDVTTKVLNIEFSPVVVAADSGAMAVERASLIAALDQARTRRVTLMSAPVGYGKSTLLASWARQLRRNGVAVAWPEFDDEMADPPRFLATLIVAVAGTITPEHSMSAAVLPTASPRFAAKRLARMLETAPMPLVVVIDDYDLVSNDEVDAIVGEFVRNLPPHVHCVLVSRTQIRIPFGALWFEANVAHFGQRELRLSDDEIAAIFEHQLSPNDLARISVWTEGWPVAVQLARHYLAMATGQERDLDALLTRADGDVGRYLSEQVLRRLPEQQRELLIRTSFLSEFKADLVEAVTGIRPAWQVLQDLLESNVLIAPVDESEGWYRCHHLLREVMYAQLRRRGHAEMTSLHQAAAQWFQANGQLREALRHARASGDSDLAARLILDAGGIFYGVRYGAPALRLLLDHLPPGIVSEYPRLSLAQVCVLTKEGKFDVAAELLRVVKLRCRDLLSARKQQADPLLIQDVAMAELMVAVYVGLHFSASSVAALERAVRDCSPEAFWLHGILNNILCITQYRGSDFTAALSAARSANYYYRQARSTNGVGHMHLHVGLIHLEQADPASASRYFLDARSVFESGLCGDDAGSAIADVLSAESLYEQGRFDEARGLCAPAAEIAESGECHYESLTSAYRTLSALAAAEESLEAAGRVLARGLSYARARRFVEVERYLALLRLELQLDDGAYSALSTDPAQLGDDLPRRQRGVDVVPWREQDLRLLLRARIAFQQGEREQAVAMLEHQVERLERDGRVRGQVRALIELAACAEASAGRQRALELLRTAIALSLPGGLIMPFIERSRHIAAALAQLVTSSGRLAPDAAECEFVKRILRFGSGRGTPEVSIFSHREQEIVRLLIQGTNNKLMARALGISPETVRFHLKNIYEKFGVNDRRIVAVLARERGLLG